jgi:hypothetical protein
VETTRYVDDNFYELEFHELPAVDDRGDEDSQ